MAIGLLVFLLLIAPALAGSLNTAISGLATGARYLPMSAANSMFDIAGAQFTGETAGESSGYWRGLSALIGWVVVSVSAGGFALVRRDI